MIPILLVVFALYFAGAITASVAMWTSVYAVGGFAVYFLLCAAAGVLAELLKGRK